MTSKKILVVEDNPVTQRVIEMSLKSAGYLVVTAGDGSSAVRVAQVENPDLITLDINLPEDGFGPDWDGFQVIEWLKRLSPGRNIPVVVISATETAKILERATAIGAYTCLPKPIRKETLLQTVAEALKSVGG